MQCNGWVYFDKKCAQIIRVNDLLVFTQSPKADSLILNNTKGHIRFFYENCARLTLLEYRFHPLPPPSSNLFNKPKNDWWFDKSWQPSRWGQSPHRTVLFEWSLAFPCPPQFHHTSWTCSNLEFESDHLLLLSIENYNFRGGDKSKRMIYVTVGTHNIIKVLPLWRNSRCFIFHYDVIFSRYKTLQTKFLFCIKPKEYSSEMFCWFLLSDILL